MLRMNRNVVLDAVFLADPRVLRNWPAVMEGIDPGERPLTSVETDR